MRKFEVGDRVVSLESGYDGEAGWPNGVVTATPELDSNLYKVTFDDKSNKTWDHFPEDMKHADPESDPINHPAHYAGSNGIECIDAMRATLTPDEFRGYCKGAAFKYIWRERQKGRNESLAKAVWYLNEAQK